MTNGPTTTVFPNEYLDAPIARDQTILLHNSDFAGTNAKAWVDLIPVETSPKGLVNLEIDLQGFHGKVTETYDAGDHYEFVSVAGHPVLVLGTNQEISLHSIHLV